MGRFLKNPDIASGTLGVKLPIGSNTLSDAPVTGVIRFNSSNNKIEFYYNNTWNQIAKVGSVQLVVDDLIGNGTSQTFTMSQAESDASAIAVFIGGVYQRPTDNYTVNGSTTITFTSPPPAPGVNPNRITIIHNLNSTDAA
jgi:hypothetical protein